MDPKVARPSAVAQDDGSKSGEGFGSHRAEGGGSGSDPTPPSVLRPRELCPGCSSSNTAATRLVKNTEWFHCLSCGRNFGVQHAPDDVLTSQVQAPPDASVEICMVFVRAWAQAYKGAKSDPNALFATAGLNEAIRAAKAAVDREARLLCEE